MVASKGVRYDAFTFSTRYYKWTGGELGEREHLLTNLKYGHSDLMSTGCRKMGGGVHEAMMEKLSIGTPLAETLQKQGQHRVVWIRVPGHFCQFFRQAPQAVPLSGGARRDRGEMLHYSFEEETDSWGFHALFNSSTFYVWYLAESDARHINPGDVAAFPILPEPARRLLSQSLQQVSRRLHEFVLGHLGEVIKSGLRIESLDSRKTKSIIDEIDTLLAAHYGFTDEELDFIINYDIKYRMGDELENYVKQTVKKWEGAES
jgi:hypothetical protein